MRAVATIGAPSTPDPIARLLAGAPETISRESCATVTLAGRHFRITKQFLDDLAPTAMERTIHGLRRALLICHAARDAIVGIHQSARIEQAAHHPKSFLALADGDHLLNNPRDAAYTGQMVAAWAARYLPEEPGQAWSCVLGAAIRSARCAVGGTACSPTSHAAGGVDLGAGPLRFRGDPQITTTKLFGGSALRVGKKVFACFYKGKPVGRMAKPRGRGEGLRCFAPLNFNTAPAMSCSHTARLSLVCNRVYPD